MFGLLTDRVRQSLPPNALANRALRALPAERLEAALDLPFEYLDFTSADYLTWLQAYLPDHGCSSPYSKKLLEFYGTYRLLGPQPTDVVLDAAGGDRTYLHRLAVRERYMHDLVITPELRRTLGEAVGYLQSDAAAIPLPDGSVDKVSCHHSFEHFERDADTRFILELQRLLRPGGQACILPLLVADRYFEVTTRWTRAKKYDRRSTRLIDPSASIPGGNAYARIYDPDALLQRVLRHVRREEFDVRIVELRMDGQPVPNLELPANRGITRINRPFRALLLSRASVVAAAYAGAGQQPAGQGREPY